MSLGEENEAQWFEPLAQIHNDCRRLQAVVRLRCHRPRRSRACAWPSGRRSRTRGPRSRRWRRASGLRCCPARSARCCSDRLACWGSCSPPSGSTGRWPTRWRDGCRRSRSAWPWAPQDGTSQQFVLGDAARLVGVGSVLGLLAAYLVMQPLAIFLVPGLAPTDPAVFVAVAVVFAVTALLASWGPTRRALNVDPIVTLRHD